ncbi:MAG: VOC family protein [Candidatus Tyrphobacter sp.]
MFVRDRDGLLAFLKAAFAAVEGPRFREDAPVDVRIGDSLIMIADADGRPVTTGFFYVYVPDADATYSKAVEAGATTLEEPALTFYGDRRAMVEDPFGNVWQIATHVRDAPVV